MVCIFTKDRWTNCPADPARCRASVADGGRHVTSHQCRRKAVIFRELDNPAGTFGFCRTHDPVAVKERHDRAMEAYTSKWGRREAIKEARENCIAALRAIEAGDNDPRATARAALDRLDKVSD